MYEVSNSIPPFPLSSYHEEVLEEGDEAAPSRFFREVGVGRELEQLRSNRKHRNKSGCGEDQKRRGTCEAVAAATE